MNFITKLKAAFGNSNTTKTSTSNDSIEAIIKDVDNTPFAISEQNVLYAGLNELGGYYFFQTVVVGTFNVKTKKGGRLVIKGNNLNLELESDSLEFETSPTNTKGRFATNIDFQIEKKEAKKIFDRELTELILTCKKQEIAFTKIKSNAQ